MRPTEKNIQDLIQNLNDQTRPELDRKILDDCMAQLDTQRSSLPAGEPNYWKTLMKNRITKLIIATAAVVAVMAGIQMLMSTPAWAFSQTLDALKNINGIYLAGVVNYPGRPAENFELWARPHSQDPSASGDFRLQEGNGHVSIASEEQNLTYVYTETGKEAIVYITEGLTRHCTPFPTGDLFKQFQEQATDWQEEYGKDPQTGRDSVFVTFEGRPVDTARYWLLQFDVKTKLPVRASVWWNQDRSGQPHLDYTAFAYNPELSEKLFQFDIPQDTQVIDCREVRRMIDENPNCGLPVDELGTAEACKAVVREYWEAVIVQDTAKIQRIRLLPTDSEQDQLVATYEANRPVELIAVTGMNHVNDPGTFAEVTCQVKTQDGKTEQCILNIDVRQSPRGRIGVVTGTVGPELVLVD